MTRKVDQLGRIILPAEYREALKIRERDELEIALKAGEIIIRKPILRCHFCGADTNLVQIGNECVCSSCIDRLCHAKAGKEFFPERTDSSSAI